MKKKGSTGAQSVPERLAIAQRSPGPSETATGESEAGRFRTCFGGGVEGGKERDEGREKKGEGREEKRRGKKEEAREKEGRRGRKGAKR